MTIFDFDRDANLQSWYIIDDVVMGGRSDGRMLLSEDGHGVFQGEVSLENNGGFSSVRLAVPQAKTAGYSQLVLRVKGDGKRYQARIKTLRNAAYSYVHFFETPADEWTEVRLNLGDFYPSYRGTTLAMDNFAGDQIEELGLLIANKKAEAFRLEIDWIQLQ